MISTSRRKLGVAAFLTLLFALLPFAAAGTAQATVIPPMLPHGQVYNGDSPRCLDSGTPNGALLFNCSTSIYQQWVYSDDEIIGNSPTGCLDDGAGLNGSRVFLAPCDGSTSQQWLNPQGGTYVNVASRKCLDADLGTIGEQGTIVQVWSCSGAPNQTWTFQFPL